MIGSFPIEFWFVLQVGTDLILIGLFLLLLRRKAVDRNGSRSAEGPSPCDGLEAALQEASRLAETFESQLQEKRRIINRLNAQLDSRIISLNLLLKRAEGCTTAGDHPGKDRPRPLTHPHDLQQQICALAEQGLPASAIAERLDLATGEVTLVLELRRKFRQLEQSEQPAE